MTDTLEGKVENPQRETEEAIIRGFVDNPGPKTFSQIGHLINPEVGRGFDAYERLVRQGTLRQVSPDKYDLNPAKSKQEYV